MRTRTFSRSRGPERAIITGIRLCLATLMLVGPLAVVAVNTSEGGLMPKRGAGLVLFVSLQRQSMS